MNTIDSTSFDEVKEIVFTAIEKRFGPNTRKDFYMALEKTSRMPEWMAFLNNCSIPEFINGVNSVILADKIGDSINGLMPDPVYLPMARDASLGEITGLTKYCVNNVLFTRQEADVITASQGRRGVSLIRGENERWNITVNEYVEEIGLRLVSNDSIDSLSVALLCAATKLLSY